MAYQMQHSIASLFRTVTSLSSRALTTIGARVVLTMLLASVVGQQAQAETIYWQLTTERITVISNGSAKRCGRIVAQFMTFERVLREFAGLDEDSQLTPVRIYSLSEDDARRVFLSEADKRQEDAQRMRIYSKYLPGPDLNVAVIVDVNGVDEPLQSVLLLYAESILTSGATRGYPLWYQIGVSNITNGLLIKDDGSVLLSREGPFEPDIGTSGRVKYDLATLLTTTARDLSNGGDWKSFSRRARELAQYGLLTTAERRAHYRELATLMRQGTPVDQAVNQAFGVTLIDFSKEFENGAWRRQAQFRISAPASVPGLPTPELLDSARSRELLQVVADRVAQQPLRQ
jgi:hypothetical protein